MYQVLVDPTTGDLLAGYSADGIHPTTLGHLEMARAYAAALDRVLPVSHGWLSTKGAGLITNPLMAGGSASTRPTEWAEMFGGSGTVVYSTQAKSGALVAGQWAEMDIDATAGAAFRGITGNATPSAVGLTPGGMALLVVQIEIVDVAGNYLAKAALESGQSWWSLTAQNGGNTQIYATAGNAGGTLTPGPIAVPFIVPAGGTSCYIWFKANMPVGTRAKFRFGCADVIDMTTLGDIEIYA